MSFSKDGVDVPSRVPDWSVNGDPAKSFPSIHRNHSKSGADCLPEEFVFKKNGRTLRANGISVDSIRYLGTCLPLDELQGFDVNLDVISNEQDSAESNAMVLQMRGERLRYILGQLNVFFEWEIIASIDFDRSEKTGQSSENRNADHQLPRRRWRFQHYSNREWRILAYVQTLCAGQKYGENWELLEWYPEWADSVDTARVASLLKAEQWDVRFGGLAYTILPKRYQEVKEFTSLLEYACHRRCIPQAVHTTGGLPKQRKAISA